MVIIGNSKNGKTKLLFKFVLKNYLEFEKLIFDSPSLSQMEYQVIIKSFQKLLSINQIRTLFEIQKHITNIDSALDIITSNDRFTRNNLEVIELKHSDGIPLPQELNSQGIKNICYYRRLYH